MLPIGLCLAMALSGCPETASNPQKDASAVDEGYHPSDAVQVGMAVAGQHPTEETDPTAFRTLESGAQLDLVFGLQGLYMVVLGLRTQDRFEGQVRVALKLTSGPTTVAEISLKDLRTVRGDDGFDYLWELRLIIDGDVWRGKDATLDIAVVDEAGHHYEDSWDVVIGEAKDPLVCDDPTPKPTRKDDHCEIPDGLVHRLDPGGPVDAIHATPGLGKTNVLVGARRGNALLLWDSGPDVNPATAHHQDLTNPEPWEDAAGPSAGPWALAVETTGPTLVWGSDDGNTYAIRRGAGRVSLGAGTPLHAFEAPDGYKVLLDNEGAVTVHSFDGEGVGLSTHFVVNMSKASGPLAPTVENTLIVVTFPGLAAEQPLWFQTASIFGGQCSLPAPLNIELGADAQRRAAGLSYGLPVFAVTRPGAAPGCQPQHRVIVAPLSGPEFLDARSVVGFDHGASIVAVDDVAGVFGLATTLDGWRLVAQWVDMKALAPGAVGTGPEVLGPAPANWAVTRQDRYAMAYSDAGGAWLQRFCFQDN